jgi:hypothetical protein
MQRGWRFRFEDRVFYVGAPDEAIAAYLMLQHLGSEASVPSREMPLDAVLYLHLADGMVIEATTFVNHPPAA